MYCPFCKSKLEAWKHDHYTVYACTNTTCVVDDMPRYKISYWDYPTKLHGRTIMIDQYYIQIDYDSQTTTISTLHAILLIDSITIPRALPVDLKNLNSIVDKIKVLLLFS